MSDTAELEAAALRARVAREKLFATAHEIQGRLDPSRMLDEAITGVKAGATDLARTAEDVARRQPGAVAAGAAAVGALIVAKPLLRLVRRLRGT